MSNTASDRVAALVQGLPKAERNFHIEGTFEPKMAFAMARHNDVDLRFESTAGLRAAYDFCELQSFLDLYYETASVLGTEHDFHDLAAANLGRMPAENIRHVEIFFDPQTHTSRGIAYDTVLDTICAALEEAEADHGLSQPAQILCFSCATAAPRKPWRSWKLPCPGWTGSPVWDSIRPRGAIRRRN
jgi:adenosine deaminase